MFRDVRKAFGVSHEVWGNIILVNRTIIQTKIEEKLFHHFFDFSKKIFIDFEAFKSFKNLNLFQKTVQNFDFQPSDG
eukprot:UN18996